MNKVILIGRLTRDPEVRYSQGENATAVARFTLAVIVDFVEPMMDKMQILLVAFALASRQNLLRNILDKA